MLSMPYSFHNRKVRSSPVLSDPDNASTAASFYYGTMAQPDHDWYLAQWLRSTGTKQADLVRETGFSPAKLSKLYNGSKRYDRDVVNAIARVLHLEPYELLMHPEDAMRIRRLRDTALSIAADNRQPFAPAPPEDDGRLRKAN